MFRRQWGPERKQLRWRQLRRRSPGQRTEAAEAEATGAAEAAEAGAEAAAEVAEAAEARAEAAENRIKATHVKTTTSTPDCCYKMFTPSSSPHQCFVFRPSPMQLCHTPALPQQTLTMSHMPYPSVVFTTYGGLRPRSHAISLCSRLTADSGHNPYFRQRERSVPLCV